MTTAAIEIGRVCVKTKGRDAGKYCVITGIVDDNFVTISGPKKLNGIKTKKCNSSHLVYTEKKLDIKEKATDEEIEQALEESKLSESFKEGLKL